MPKYGCFLIFLQIYLATVLGFLGFLLGRLLHAVELVKQQCHHDTGIDFLLRLLLLPRGCRQKSLLQIITARSWQMARYDAALLA